VRYPNYYLSPCPAPQIRPLHENAMPPWQPEFRAPSYLRQDNLCTTGIQNKWLLCLLTFGDDPLRSITNSGIGACAQRHFAHFQGTTPPWHLRGLSGRWTSLEKYDYDGAVKSKSASSHR